MQVPEQSESSWWIFDTAQAANVDYRLLTSVFGRSIGLDKVMVLVFFSFWKLLNSSYK